MKILQKMCSRTGPPYPTSRAFVGIQAKIGPNEPLLTRLYSILCLLLWEKSENSKADASSEPAFKTFHTDFQIFRARIGDSELEV